MEDAVDDLPANHNLKCHVCGENKFEEREGFYYCQECGTKQEQVRLIEIERDDEFDPEKFKAAKQKIHIEKVEKPQLTSWECYNYMLRGFVEELLSLGAKEELKLMALQVWAAYLRRMQVAFFNRKKPDLPKLGIIYLQNDAQTIYNHAKKAKKIRKRRRSEGTSCTSGGESKSSRNWNRNKRKLDESNYSLTSATSGGSGFTSSTSGNSNRAIKIGFNAKARAYLKRRMPIKHLEKHATDAEGLLTCHKQPISRQINRTDYYLMSMNIKQIYSILAISLNLIGDDIQLCDFVRFINEGHFGAPNVLQYFPENIANDGVEMLKKINFYKCPEKYYDKALRDHIAILCKHIGINALKAPDIIKLVQRYTTELCLPAEFAVYIERLINFLPPTFKTRAIGHYPAFEARAMAYIIFTLKLFFGLDDNKEHRISRATKNLNSRIYHLNRRKREIQPSLFVWNEWVEYIEMRKIIVSQFNTSFCEQFKQCQSTNQVLEQMAEEMRRTEETNNLYNDTSEKLNFTQKLKNFKSLFERFQETYKLTENDNKKPTRIHFKPSFTPALSYLKNILLLSDRERNANLSINVKIPDFMRIDHSQRDISSYLQVKPLIKYFERHQLKLNVHVLATTENKQYVGIFRTPRKCNPTILYKSCFDVTEDEWAKATMAEYTERTDDLAFTTDLNTYRAAVAARKKLQLKRKAFFDPLMNYDIAKIRDDTDVEGNIERIKKENLPENNYTRRKSKQAKEDQQSVYSFELFSENNMDPINGEYFITKPRRNLENIDLFEQISDEESVLNDDDGNDANILDDSELNVLNDDTFLSVAEEFIKIEPNSLNDSGLQQTKEKNDLKMYISNMDYWMILGFLSNTNKAQRSQLQDKFPRSFNWLLETCAQTINVEWSVVFDQLLCIESMFCLGINDTDTFKNCVFLNSYNPLKEIQMIINSYREIW